MTCRFTMVFLSSIMPPVNQCTLMLALPVWGPFFDNQVYALLLPGSWQDVNIAYIEMINILVALKVCHVQWAGLKVSIKCDNQAVVSVLSTGKTRDKVTAKYARNVFLWLSAFNIYIQVVHIPGKMNPVDDFLSRWHKTVNNVSKLQALVHPVIWIHIVVMPFNLCFRYLATGTSSDTICNIQALQCLFRVNQESVFTPLQNFPGLFGFHMCLDIHRVTK